MRRRQQQPPIGYADWYEAARDARLDGILIALDIHDRDYECVVPEGIMAIERARRAKAGLVPPAPRRMEP